MSSFKAFSRLIIPSVAAGLAATPVVPSSTTNETQISKSHKLRPSELPIYDEDGGDCGCSHGHTMNSTSLREKTALENEIHKIILAMDDSLGVLKSSKDRIIDFIEVGKAHTLDAVEILRDESNLMGRVGAISLGGLTGLLLGIRGGFFKKFLYSTVGASAIASVCYPNEAGQISRSVYTISKYYAIVGYNKVQDELHSRREAKAQSTQSTKTASNADTIGEQKKPSPDVKKHQEKMVSSSDKSTQEKSKGDFGQSNPEDRDMYTTRGS